MEYKPQSAYIVAKKDNTKQETQNVIYIDIPKIYFHSLDYPNQWWQGESPITFTSVKIILLSMRVILANHWAITL